MKENEMVIMFIIGDETQDYRNQPYNEEAYYDRGLDSIRHFHTLNGLYLMPVSLSRF